MDCQTCSAPNKKLFKCWYNYNGSQFKIYACHKCIADHRHEIEVEPIQKKEVKT